MATIVRSQILSETHAAKFYCIILDTTPDISHIDQLAFSIRYVSNGKPLKRFLCFDEMNGSKAVDFKDKFELVCMFKMQGAAIFHKLLTGYIVRHSYLSCMFQL